MAKPSLDPTPESKKYYAQLTLTPYKRGDAFKLETVGTPLIVKLPLPTEMRDDTTVGYTNVNLETVGDIFNKSDVYAGALARNSGNILSAFIGAAKGGFDNTGALGKLLGGGAMGIAQSLLPAEQVTSALQQQNGVAPNPNPSVQFQGPVLRDFTLTWAFYPKNKEESKEIDLLIRKLKARALPSLNTGTSTSVLNFPHICQINFYPWDAGGVADPNGWSDNSIIKIKKCFMSGVNVNYHAFGTPAFFADTTLPVTYQLTINFKEIEYLLASDWDASGDDTTKERKEFIKEFSGIKDSLIAGLGVLKDAGFGLVEGFSKDLGTLANSLLETPDKTPADQRVSDLKEMEEFSTFDNPGTLTTTNPDGTKFEMSASGITTGNSPSAKYEVVITTKDGKTETKTWKYQDYKDEASTTKEKQALAYADMKAYLDEQNAWGAKPAQ